MDRAFGEGEPFGDYTLLRRLAVGGMGEIFVAERRGISGFAKRVVIKTILDCFVDDPELVEMFLEEGRIAASLNHPSIAQTFDLGQVGSTYFLAMEYVHGRDLREILVANVEWGRQIPLNLVLRIIAQTCEGLYYAHTLMSPDGQPAGVVHRDISPQNILVTFDGAVKIVDFGIAKAAHRASKTRSGVLKGKYAYMSPEQVRGKGVDPRSDLFSLGVVMYELVTARRLFKRDSEMATLDAVLEANVPPPTRLDQSIPSAVESVLLRALHKDPDQRYADARQMQLAIEELMLTANLPASSAHLSAYMHEMFPQRAEPESDAVAQTNRKMASLPGVGERGLQLERTKPYTPGIDLEQVGRRGDVLTGNLLLGPSTPSGSSRSVRAAGSRSAAHPVAAKAWLLLILLAMVVAGGGWWLIANLLRDGATAGLDAGIGGTTLDAGGVTEPASAQAHAGFPPVDAGLAAAPDGGDTEQTPDEGDGVDGAEESANSHLSGALNVATEKDAEVFLGRTRIGHGSVRGYPVKPGTYRLRVVNPFGASRNLGIKVFPGKAVTRRVDFGSGKVRLVVMPWANVWLDGKRVGQTPLKAIGLPEGSHQLKLVNPDLGKQVEQTVVIRPGKETFLKFDWR